MKINIDEIRSLPKQQMLLNFKEQIEGLEAVKPVIGEIFISANSTGVRLTGNLQTLLKLTCDRCLQPYFLNITMPLDERLLEKNIEQNLKFPKELELKSDDFVEYLDDDGSLDITDLVYQAVTLAIPPSCLCGENCPGPPKACAESEKNSLVCDKDTNDLPETLDPRWQNLKTLFPKKDIE